MKIKKILYSFSQKLSPALVNGLAIEIISLEDFCRYRETKKEVLYTPDELAYCQDRILSLAGRFVAKMAVRRVAQQEIPWTAIQILPSLTQQPVITFSERQHAQNMGVSITHDTDIVAAFAASSVSAGKKVHVGIDVTDNHRIENLLTQPHGEKVLTRILTPQEQKETKNTIQVIAKKWAGKEAICKAIGTGMWQGVSLHEIEILTQNGEPFVMLRGNALVHARAKNILKWNIAFLEDQAVTFAFVTGYP